MAKAPTDEQNALRRRARRRLIGAIALATLIAVILPWVLEREPRHSEQEIAIQIPSPDASAFSPNMIPPKPIEAERGATGEASTPGDAPPATAPPASDVLSAEQQKVLAPPALPKSAAPKPAAQDKPAPEAKKKPTETAPADGKQYVVQVTALADADKAGSIQKELVAKGLRAYTEVVKTSGADVTRVRVGPFPNREAADKERARLKTLGFDGNVVAR